MADICSLWVLRESSPTYLWFREFDGDLLSEEGGRGGAVGGVDGVLDDGEVEVGDGPRHARLRDRQVVKVA